MKSKISKISAIFMAAFMLICMLPVNLITAEGEIPIDEEHFPDENFRNFIATGQDYETKVSIDTDGNGSLSENELAAAKNFNVNFLDIADLTGIEYFTGLRELWASANQLTSLDVSNNTELKWLGCSQNQLTSLDLSNNTDLTYFDCNDSLYAIPASPYDLTGLPEGFDINRASDWQNGTVEGNILTFIDKDAPVTYTYDCGNGYEAVFSLYITEILPGDYDCSGTVDMADAVLTLRAAMQIETPSDQSLANADIDGDGILTVPDALAILRMALQVN